jgi:hypothetical protein
MRLSLLILAAMAWGLSSPAFCDDAPDPPPPAFYDDPSLAASIHFQPAVTTAGVAATGPTLGAANRARTLPCTTTNPCAMATPAANSVLPAR